MNVSIGLNPFHKILWNVTKILKRGTALITLCSYNQHAWGKYLKYLTALEGYFSTDEASLVPPSGRSSPTQNSGASWGCGILEQMSIWDSSYSKRDPTRCVLRISHNTMIIEKQTNIWSMSMDRQNGNTPESTTMELRCCYCKVWCPGLGQLSQWNPLRSTVKA